MRDVYIFELRGGASKDPKALSTISVNNEEEFLTVANELFEGKIRVRLRDYDGLPVGNDKETLCPNSPYFEGNYELSSIEVSGIFKNGPLEGGAWPADDIYFGNHFDAPLRLPPGASVALKFAQFFDPGLQYDLHASKPYAHSPLLVTFNTVSLTKKTADIPAPLKATKGQPLKEDCTLLSSNYDAANDHDGKLRRKHFSSASALKEVSLGPQTLFRGDFFNPYLDFNNRGVKIPLLTIPIMGYWDGQPLNYVCSSVSTKKVFFVISFMLHPISEALGSTTDELDID
ncbi:hypothetical protein DSO57_1019162 [Entomophthora muscae]|uniref:Uncharacterized protein n=1 Tax=Entomophthora muscae TaxID=34485 RepID=A0ACC2RVD8_9FUNG|nr:hypothetical protein DSO57_1019162 [Entomophthora muscae]